MFYFLLASLVVLAVEPDSVKIPSSITVKAGQSVTLTCEVDGGCPPTTTYEWLVTGGRVRTRNPQNWFRERDIVARKSTTLENYEIKTPKLRHSLKPVLN